MTRKTLSALIFVLLIGFPVPDLSYGQAFVPPPDRRIDTDGVGKMKKLLDFRSFGERTIVLYELVPELQDYPLDNLYCVKEVFGVVHEGQQEIAGVLFKPVGPEELSRVKVGFYNQNDIVEVSENKPWLAFVLYNGHAFVFEYRRSLSGFYRLWKPNWHFVGKVEDNHYKFIYQRYGINLERDYNQTIVR